MNIPIEPKKDSHAVEVTVVAGKDDKDRETARSRQIANAIVDSYAAHLEAWRQAQPDPARYVIDREEYVWGVVLKHADTPRYADRYVLRLAVNSGSGYFGARTLTNITLMSGGFRDRARRRYDLRVLPLTATQHTDFAAGQPITLTVTANWSKLWTAALAMIDESLRLEILRTAHEQKLAERRREVEEAARPVTEALRGVLSHSTGFEFEPKTRVYAYSAAVQPVQQPDGSYRFSVSLGKDESAPDGYTSHPRLPVELAQQILDALTGSGAQVRLVLDHLTADAAVAVLKHLPQQKKEQTV